MSHRSAPAPIAASAVRRPRTRRIFVAGLLALMVLAGVASRFAWFAPPGFVPATGIPIRGATADHDSRVGLLERDAPYVLHVVSDAGEPRGELVYFGSVHSKDADHPQLTELRRVWDRFRTEARAQLVDRFQRQLPDAFQPTNDAEAEAIWRFLLRAPDEEGMANLVRTTAGEVMAKVLGRKNDQTIELTSLNPAHKPRELAAADIEWIARIVWASQ